MKKIITLLAMSILLVSCGQTVVEEDTTNTPEQIIMDESMMDDTMNIEGEVIVEENAEETLSEEEIDAAVEDLFNSLED